MNTSFSPDIEGVLNEDAKAAAARNGALPRFLARAAARLEYCAVYALGVILGIGVVVRYLRNPNPSVTPRLLRSFGATIGEHTTVKGSFLLDNVLGDATAAGDLSHLIVGNNCYIGDSVFVDLAGTVRIEDNAVIAGRVALITHAECKRSSYLNSRFPRRCAPVVVGSGAWVGFGSTVLAGVTIGRNTVIGASSLVTQDAEPECVYAGTPASKKRHI